MKIKIDELFFNILLNEKGLNTESIPVVFLHGFTGSSFDWNFLFKELPDGFNPIAIDLIGHGKSISPNLLKHYTTNSITKQINNIFIELNLIKPIVVGYSMGARAALAFTINNPYLVRGLMLESSTAGIVQENLRKERIKSDELLVKMINEDGIENFINYWMDLPIFHSQKSLPSEKLKEIKNEKLKNNQTGLVNSLKGFGAGVFPNYWGHLKKIKVKTLLLTGELDKKYCEINSKLVKLLPDAEHKIAIGAGHNSHLEKPGDFIIFLNQFLENFK